MVTQRIFLLTLLFVAVSVKSLAQELRIDHVIQLHPNLASCIEEYTKEGFTVKRGSHHDNGLINAHIKFPNATSLELMTLEGEPSDPISKKYETLLSAEKEGAYVAFTGLSIGQIEAELKNLNIAFETSEGRLWSYVSFDEASELAHIFFIIYHRKPNTSDKYVTHKNGFSNIKSISIEGTSILLQLLKSLGVNSEKTGPGMHKLTTSTGVIIVHEIKSLQGRPKIHKVILGKSHSQDTYSIKLD